MSERESPGIEKPRIGISACLLGDEVRFDGGHKREPFLTDVLGPHVDWIRVCPEVEVGMGTPRETLRLVRDGDGPVRMMTTRTGVDHTASMERWSRRRLEALADEDLSGYVLKKDSPSCGMERVKVFGRGRDATAQRPGHLRGGAARAASQPAGRGRGAALQSGPARELHRAGVRLSASAPIVRAAMDGRRPCRISHGAQDDAAVALDRELPAARPARRRGGANAARDAPFRVRDRCSCRPCASPRPRGGIRTS